MRSDLRTLLAAFALTLTAGAGLGGDSTMAQTLQPGSPSSPSPQPSLSVALTAAPAQSTFSLGQPVTINLNLVNQSSTAAGLSDLLDGNLRIVSFTRNGTPVPFRTTSIDYDNSLPSEQESRLAAVSPGASLPLTWQSDRDNVQGSHALRVVTLETSGDTTARLYTIAAPGTYQITFFYQYCGTTGTFPGAVFTGQTNTVTVTFNVF